MCTFGIFGCVKPRHFKKPPQFLEKTPRRKLEREREKKRFQHLPEICIEKNNCNTKCVKLQGYREKSFSRRKCIMEVRFCSPSKQTKRGVRGNPLRRVREDSKRQHRLQNTSLPHSTVQKEDDVRRETVNLTHQFKTHPNRESLMADLNKNQKFNQFTEKSKELIHSMGKHEVLRAVRDLFYNTVPRLFIFWEK